MTINSLLICVSCKNRKRQIAFCFDLQNWQNNFRFKIPSPIEVKYIPWHLEKLILAAFSAKRNRSIVFSIKPKFDFVDLCVLQESRTWNCVLFWIAELAEQFQVQNLYKICKPAKIWSSNFGLIEKILNLSRIIILPVSIWKKNLLKTMQLFSK